MLLEDCFQLGHVSRLHGYKGSIVAFFDTDRPEAYLNLESVLIDQDGELIPFFIEELSRNSKGHFILKLEDLKAEEASSFIGAELYLPLNLLPPLTGKQFYFHEVADFSVLDKETGLIGHLDSLLDSGAQPLFKIINAAGSEILVPAIDDFIEKIDREKREIHLILPEGLLEVYS
jgi:16S rRNA processing protein RimM